LNTEKISMVEDAKGDDEREECWNYKIRGWSRESKKEIR